MNVNEGQSGTDQWEVEGEKKIILRHKEDRSTLHRYIQRQYNETLQTLLEKWGRNKVGNRNRMEGVDLFKVHCMHVWDWRSVSSGRAPAL
jgi:hypothetical protein